MLSTGLTSCFIMGAVTAGTGLLWIEPMARIMGATETILPYACDYMRFILLGSPFVACSLVLNT